MQRGVKGCPCVQAGEQTCQGQAMSCQTWGSSRCQSSRGSWKGPWSVTPQTGRTKDKRPPTHLSQAAKGDQLRQEGGGQIALRNIQGTECPLPLPTHPPIPPLSSYLH